MMLYVTLLMICVLVVYKLIQVGPFIFSVGTLVFPFLYVLSDIIAEVYGFRVARILLYTSFYCEILFALILYGLVHISSPLLLHNSDYFTQLIGPLPKVALTNAIAMIAGSYVNIYFISKWKVLLRGKYFWVRSIGSSSIGEAVFTVIAFTLYFIGHVSFQSVLTIILSTYLIKIVYAIILSGPANLLVYFLKSVDCEEAKTQELSFNPFKKKCENKI